MGQVIQVNGDYNIKAKEGARITLDTGPAVGEVRVTGNLVVDGDTLTVSAENLQVQDNVITLNYGETGAGVSLRYSGIEVDRGTEPRTAFIYDEDDGTWNIGEGTALSGYSLINSRLRVTEILTDADVNDGDLTLVGTGTGVITVVGTNNYEDQVTDDDDIPNKRYVDRAIENSPTYQITRNDTRVIAFDKDLPVDPTTNFPPAIGPFTSQPAESQVAIIVENLLSGAFYSNRAYLQGLTIFTEDDVAGDPFIPNTSVIQASNTNANIKLETSGTGKVQITYATQFDHHGLTPAVVNNSSLLYGGTAGTGTTGLYFVNSTKSDELISKGRALVYSMIF